MKRWTLITALILAVTAQAAPASWYQWQSKATGRYMCAQIDPGDAWVRHSGPYNNAGCRPR
ncbi:hypothetical protein D9M71_636400 [compost metagenome]|jgi:hypothetical protein|uniref:hypothetical protein n=1 Tax=Pseudomonas TaxID=286 RepID=UPI0004103D6C|nr:MULTISPECIES: hypothetical protein [Pseudomonas]MCW2267480.1 hypothetical protein [Pseudomonas sp. JUb96]PRA69526.1 hypothetical protein CQ065_08100 [Pseudomonas sp. MYb187]